MKILTVELDDDKAERIADMCKMLVYTGRLQRAKKKDLIQDYLLDFVYKNVQLSYKKKREEEDAELYAKMKEAGALKPGQ